jgi:hypothetical protein
MAFFGNLLTVWSTQATSLEDGASETSFYMGHESLDVVSGQFLGWC